jgi:hypothetical protein
VRRERCRNGFSIFRPVVVLEWGWKVKPTEYHAMYGASQIHEGPIVRMGEDRIIDECALAIHRIILPHSIITIPYASLARIRIGNPRGAQGCVSHGYRDCNHVSLPKLSLSLSLSWQVTVCTCGAHVATFMFSNSLLSCPRLLALLDTPIQSRCVGERHITTGQVRSNLSDRPFQCTALG